MITNFNSHLNLQIDVLTFNKNDDYKTALINFLLKQCEMIAPKSSYKEYLVLNTLFDSDFNDKFEVPPAKKGDSESSHETSLSVSPDAPNCANTRLASSSTPSADLNSSASLSMFIALSFKPVKIRT